MRYVITILILALPVLTFGSTIHVSPEGPLTIQQAIDTAVDGDVIILMDGTFTGDGNRDITFRGKTITVRSEAGDPTRCIIDCHGSEADPHRGFLFEDNEPPEALLAGVTITNGHHDWGGGIRILYPSAVTIRKCHLVDNEAGEGGGMASGHVSQILDCVFVNNTATAGGGLSTSCSYDDFPLIADCFFYGNTALDVGGGFRT